MSKPGPDPFLAADDDHTSRLWPKTAMLLLFTLLVLAVFQSASLVTASYDLPAGTATEAVIAAAEGWHEKMQSVGAAGVSEKISERLETLRQTRVVEEAY